MDLNGYDWFRLALRIVGIVLFTIVARFLSKREVSDDARLAQRSFAVWWAGLAGIGVYSLVTDPAWGINPALHGVTVALALLWTLLVIIYGMIAGLVYYLLYVYTGKRKMWVVPAGFYLAVTLFTVYFFHGFGGACIYEVGVTDCVEPSSWTDRSVAEISSHQPRPELVGDLFGLLIVGPIFGGALMYFLLFFKVKDATSRYRVATVSGGLVLWFGFGLANTFRAAANVGEGSQVVSQALGVLAAMLVMLAYFPPKWVQARGIRPIED